MFAKETGGGIAEIAADQATRVVRGFYDTSLQSPILLIYMSLHFALTPKIRTQKNMAF